MIAQTYQLVKSARKIDVSLSASALVYEVFSQLITLKNYHYKELCDIFYLNVFSLDDEADSSLIENSAGILATSDEYPVIAHEDDLLATRENMYFSKPIQSDKEPIEKIYVSHQWSRWLNDDGSKRAKGYLFFCIESFISICSKLGFEIVTNPSSDQSAPEVADKEI